MYEQKERIVVAVCLYVFVWDGAGIHTSRHIAHAGGFRQGEGKVGHRAGTLDGGLQQVDDQQACGFELETQSHSQDYPWRMECLGTGR